MRRFIFEQPGKPLVILTAAQLGEQVMLAITSKMVNDADFNWARYEVKLKFDAKFDSVDDILMAGFEVVPGSGDWKQEQKSEEKVETVKGFLDQLKKI